jgi:hypothetical protein
VETLNDRPARGYSTLPVSGAGRSSIFGMFCAHWSSIFCGRPLTWV